MLLLAAVVAATAQAQEAALAAKSGESAIAVKTAQVIRQCLGTQISSTAIVTTTDLAPVYYIMAHKRTSMAGLSQFASEVAVLR
jgi:hypothetical protein